MTLHRRRTCPAVTAVRTRTQTDNGSETVTPQQGVGPDPRRAPISVTERVDASPLGMRPRTQIDDGGETVPIEFLSGRIAGIQRRNGSL
jgi:hypothetical protein